MAAARKAKKTTTRKASRRKPSAKAKKVSKTTNLTAPKKAIASKKSKPKSSRNSVDSILVEFAKRRIEHEAKLAAVRKKIAQLEAKMKAYQAEIVSLKETESSTETIVGNLDLDRDQAVRDLLEKLGVKLVSNSAAEPSPEPEEVQAKRSFDTVFGSPTTSNGNPPAPELPPSLSSDELLDDELMDDDQD